MTAVAAVETIEQKYERYGLHPRMATKFDHSTSGTFQECERMYYWLHELGRVPKIENYSFRWGRVFHKVTEVFGKTENPDAVMQIILDELPEITDDRYGRNRKKMIDLFIAWADFNVRNPLEVLYYEQPVLLTCWDEPCPYNPNGCGLAYGGRLDNIVHWSGIAGPLDKKTSVRDEDDPIAEYKPSHQMMGYTWLASHLTGRHIWGVILEKAVCNKSKMFIKRYPIPFSKDLIREWAENEVELQKRIHERHKTAAYNQSAWLMNHFRCYKPFRCAYRDVCTSSRDMDFRFRWLQENTVEARWDFMNPGARDEAWSTAVEE